MKKYIILILWGFFGLYAQDSLKDTVESIPSIESLKGLELYGNDDYIFLDVRTVYEHEMKAIPKTQVIPVQELEDRVEELKPIKDKKIIVYCRSGNRSRTGTKILLKHGYDATNLLGGMNHWKGPVTVDE